MAGSATSKLRARYVLCSLHIPCLFDARANTTASNHTQEKTQPGRIQAYLPCLLAASKLASDGTFNKELSQKYKGYLVCLQWETAMVRYYRVHIMPATSFDSFDDSTPISFPSTTSHARLH